MLPVLEILALLLELALDLLLEILEDGPLARERVERR
jgi:hypothetical protein